jgi:hypothetical protein
MPFVFLENSTIQDEKNRKLIRSHCMKGKNVGKNKLRVGLPTIYKAGDMAAVKSWNKNPDINESLDVSIKSAFSDRFAMCSLPAHLDTRMHDLLYRCKSQVSSDQLKILANWYSSFTHKSSDLSGGILSSPKPVRLCLIQSPC